MAFVLKDRVKETTTTTGTGTVTLAGATTGYQSFSAIGNGNTTYYTIAGQGTSEWEVGIGTYTSSGTTLSRDTVLASSNSGSLVNFSSGTKDVFCDYPAGKSVTQSTVYAPSTFLGTFADGIVMDYTSGNGRVSVGSADTLTFYNGGVATTQLGQFSSAGDFSATGNIAAGNGLIVNSKTVSASYSIPSGSNAMSVGPVTVSSGKSVTVPSGSRWLVL